jgi:DNA modification methylase
MNQTYEQFLEAKMLKTPSLGFEVEYADINPICFPHQKDCIAWAARGGRRALFLSFGLGKTIIQLELASLCIMKRGGKAIIVCPLGVKQEFKKDAKLLGMEIEYVRNMEEVEACKTPFMITNYERVREGNIDPSYFTFASLDEASVLRSYGSKTYQEFLPKFDNVRYRYVCTATPSPNKFKELIHYAGFLGVMDTGQALTRFFKRDSTKANNLTLHPHKEREFWLWMSTWAIFLTKPSDLGYSDEGYDLPDLDVKFHVVKLEAKENIDRNGQAKLYRDMAIDLKSSAKEKRESLSERLQVTMNIIEADAPDKHWIVWHSLENERHAIEKNIDCKTVYGSQAEEEKERLLIEFGDGKYRILATKTEIAGSGCNFQHHCHANIFMGIDYKFNDFVQAIFRTQRFQQKHRVEVHIIYTDTEDQILKTLLQKWEKHKELVKNMTDIIKEYGLSNQSDIELKRSMGVQRSEVKGQLFTTVHNDNVPEVQSMEQNSVGMIVTSIPFSNHYEYTPSYNDFGHTQNDDHFFAQMDFLTPELLRVLKPGRIAAIHVKDRILFGSVTGYGMPSVNPFHAKTISHYMKHGFIYMGMITIETDVVRENNQTYRLGWSEQCKDGSKMGVGSPEYLLIFRKLPTDNSRAYADEPVTKSKKEYTRGRWQIDARAKWNSSGDRLLNPDELSKFAIDRIGKEFSEVLSDLVYDYDQHVNLANALDDKGKLPATFETLKVPARRDDVWHDINRMNTLNSQQTQSREQNHICPLQLDIIKRSINRWSNEGDLVLDPFGGLGSTAYTAIKMNRRGYSIELNPDYHRCAVGYLRAAEYKKSVPTLFDDMSDDIDITDQKSA